MFQHHCWSETLTADMGGWLNKPWRDLPENSQENLNFVKSYQPRNEEVKHLRILLIGRVSGGKSSFINSVDSVFQERITCRAAADAVTEGSSVTSKYRTYKIRSNPERSYSFIFNATMGFERSDERGVHVEDVKLALKGHVKEGYKPTESFKEEDFYNPFPTLDDRVHLLVSVVPADKMSIMREEDVKNMRECCAAIGRNKSQHTDTIPKVMGRSQSKDIILDAFDEDWREIPMSKEEYLDYVKNYQLHHDDIEQLRILLHGPVGSGKSSFINSVDTVLQGRMAGRALADGIIVSSFTTEFRTFKIQKEARGTFYPFAFTDIMGLEKNKGVCVEDIKLAMKGHVKDRYKFNPSTAISDTDNGYNNNPSLNDKVHVLVCVVSAETLNVMNPETMKKMREVRLAARDLGIPQLAVLTKIDEACPIVKKDVGNVYKSIKVKELIEKLSAELGIPPAYIFPVKNYHWEIAPEDVSDRLILSALKQMIDFGDDCVNKDM